MSAENDLALAYHMGYDDALAKRRPDASKAQVLAPYDLDAENARLRAMRDTWAENDARLRELVRELYEDQCDECDRWRYRDRLRELGIEASADA